MIGAFGPTARTLVRTASAFCTLHACTALSVHLRQSLQPAASPRVAVGLVQGVARRKLSTPHAACSAGPSVQHTPLLRFSHLFLFCLMRKLTVPASLASLSLQFKSQPVWRFDLPGFMQASAACTAQPRQQAQQGLTRAMQQGGAGRHGLTMQGCHAHHPECNNTVTPTIVQPATTFCATPKMLNAGGGRAGAACDPGRPDPHRSAVGGGGAHFCHMGRHCQPRQLYPEQHDCLPHCHG